MHRFISGAVDIIKQVKDRITYFVAKKLLNAQTNQLLLAEYSSRRDPRRGDKTKQRTFCGGWGMDGAAGSVVFSEISPNVIGRICVGRCTKSSPSQKFSFR